MYWNDRWTLLVGSLDVSGANSSVLEISMESDLKRIIFAHSTAHTAAASEITVIRRPMNGASGTTLGTFTIPATAAANIVYYVDLAVPDGLPETLVDGSTGYNSAPEMPRFSVGEELVLTSDGGGDAGTATFWAEFQSLHSQPLPESWVELAFTAA